MTYRAIAFFVLAGSCLVAGAFADDTQALSKSVPELQVLKHWIGTWDVEMIMKPSAELPNGMSARGVTKAEWILDGRFVQQTGSLKPKDNSPTMHATTLMTYDTDKKVYRSWTFFSSGHVSENEGRWDEKSRTMTSTRRDAATGRTTTVTATFAADGSESWRYIEKDRDGNIVGDTTGKNTPRKK